MRWQIIFGLAIVALVSCSTDELEEFENSLEGHEEIEESLEDNEEIDFNIFDIEGIEENEEAEENVEIIEDVGGKFLTLDGEFKNMQGNLKKMENKENFENIEELKEAINVIKPNLENYAEKGFETALKRIELAKTLAKSKPVRSSNPYHPRKNYDEEKIEKISCFNEGMLETKDLILSEINYPASVTEENVLELVGTLPRSICKKMADKCNAGEFIEDLKEEKPETRLYTSRYCYRYKYRTIDGTCNNPIFINRGAAGTPMQRLLYPLHDRSDRIYPNARLISSTLNSFESTTEDGPQLTVLFMLWGQFIDHDFVLTPTVPNTCDCCVNFNYKPDLHGPNCHPILIPYNDPFYKNFPNSVNCLPFTPSASLSRSCAFPDLTQRTMFNENTHFLDLSQVYGSSYEELISLRDENSFTMKLSKIYNDYHDGCDIAPKYMANLPDDSVFNAGDERFNENPGLTSLQTIFPRLHNIIADLLHELYPTYSSQHIFDLTRRINIALMQKITYTQFLPLLFPKALLNHFGLLIDNRYYSHYDPAIDPSVFVEMAIAFRLGHSLIPKHLFNDILFDDVFGQGPPILNSENITTATIIEDVSTNAAPFIDTHFEEVVHNHLFQIDFQGRKLGQDLGARNVQRTRDQQVPPLNDYRRKLNLGAITRNNIYKYLRPGLAEAFLDLYGSMDDIGLFEGGMAEKPLSGSKIGPTFSIIILNQFRVTRFGDSFWFENVIRNKGILELIKSTTLADILCETTCLRCIADNPMAAVSRYNSIRDCQERRYDTNNNLIAYLRQILSDPGSEKKIFMT